MLSNFYVIMNMITNAIVTH